MGQTQEGVNVRNATNEKPRQSRPLGHPATRGPGGDVAAAMSDLSDHPFTD